MALLPSFNYRLSYDSNGNITMSYDPNSLGASLPDPPTHHVLNIPLEEVPRLLTAIRWSEVPWAMELHDGLLKTIEVMLSTTGQELCWENDEYTLQPKKEGA